ncbi:M48 family metalloprotease [Streptomyces decoyicus]|uniref:M48 family metalloprotease n=1 Tax=Streptomyces decoyicus TaxID=249567 RepID=UPI0033A608BD
MSGDTVLPPRSGNVDERILGAGTGLRFALLLVLFLTSSATVASKIIESLADPRNIRVGCALAAGGNPESDYLGIALATMRAGDAYRACLSRYVPSASAWVPLAVLAVLLTGAGALYWTLPRWKGRRGRVVPVRAVDPQGELRLILDELVGVAGLSGRPPRFVIARAEATAGAVVFGRLRRYSVCLHGGLVARRRSDPEGFRAVVLHELAHIRNRDIDLTYATVALWRVFLVAVLPAYLVWAALDLTSSAASAVLGPAERIGTGHELLLSAMMIAFVYLARADILRARETYADLDALAWGADAGGWHHATPQGTGAGRARRALASFVALWRTHPAWDRRLASLTDPRELFEPHALTLFVAGATATIVGDQLTDLLDVTGMAWALRLLTALLAGLIVAIPGVALWRAAARAVLTGSRVPSGLRAGWWLGVGLAVGELLTSSTSGSTRLLPRHPEALMLLIVISVGIMCWTAQYAELSVRSWRGRTLRPAMLLGLAATWVVFALWYAWWQTDGQVLTMGWAYSETGIREALQRDLPGTVPGHEGALSAIAATLPVLLPIGTDPFVLWAAAVLWLLPLLAWLRRPAAGTPQWARGTLRSTPGPALPTGQLPSLHGTPGPTLPTGLLPSLRRVLLAAGLGALVCWAGTVAVMASLHTWQPPPERRYGTYLLLFLASVLIVLVCGTVVTAALTSVIASRFPLLVALVAAGTTALLGLAGVFVLGSADGCLGPLNTLGSTCRWRPDGFWPLTELLLPLVLGLGIFVSAVAALLGSAARRALQLPRRPVEKPAIRARRTEPGRGRLTARRLWVAAVCLAMVALSTVTSLPSGAGPPARTSLTKEQLLPGAAIPAASPQVLGLQTDAWLRLGGRDLTGRFGGELLRLITALQDKSALTDRRFAATRIRPHCLAVEHLAAEARTYFPLPDPRTQQRWEKLQTQGKQAGADCDRAITDGKFTVFTKAMNTFVTMARTMTELLDTIGTAAAHAGTRR